MTHIATCKICGQTFSVEIDDLGAKLLSPQMLLALATCNGCADNRVKKPASRPVVASQRVINATHPDP